MPRKKTTAIVEQDTATVLTVTDPRTTKPKPAWRQAGELFLAAAEALRLEGRTAWTR
jgi:hypothetical protein